MPALKIYGRRWHTTTDMVPVPCILGSVFHGAWVVIFICLVRHYHIWGECMGDGKHYVVTTAGLMAVFVLCFVGELVLAILGVQGLYIPRTEHVQLSACNSSKGAQVDLFEVSFYVIGSFLYSRLW